MKDGVVLDTNLLVLLVVGSASRNYIGRHKRLSQYSDADFELLVEIIGGFSEILLVPHILSEVSSLVRQIDNPARKIIQATFRQLIATTYEIPLPSTYGARRFEFDEVGLTDAMILHLCNSSESGIDATLITVDTDLANHAHALGYGVIDYKQEYQS